jgi:hypothetical protein
MEGINSFEKGLHRTNTPVEQPEGSYVDALNWIRNDSGRLVNEELEELVKSLPNYVLLGYTPVNDLFICFFQVNGVNSEIGTFSKGTYTQVFTDTSHSNYNLDFKKEIDCVARVNSKGEKVVYFVEEDKPARRFNLDIYTSTNTTYDTLEDFNLQLTYKMPYCNLNVVQSGGLASGVYSVVLRYRDEANNKTACNIPTRFISITDDIAPTTLGKNFSDSIDGCAPGTITSKSIDITLKHVDTNYKFIEVIIITYIGITNVLTIKSLGIYTNIPDRVINFSSLLQLEDSVPIEEITENPIFYTSAKSIEQKDNILILSNLTSKKYDAEFQKVANNIELHWYIQKYNLQSPRLINSKSKSIQAGSTRPYSYWDYREEVFQVSTSARNALPYVSFSTAIIDATDFWQSNIYQDPTVPKGFTRGEVYSFSITPIYKDGSLGFAYHIPGKVFNSSFPKRLKAWVSSEEYPEYMKQFSINNTNKIQHHQMPDFNEPSLELGEHIFDETSNEKFYTGSYINVLRVAAKNINFGSSAPLIQGYIIGYQQRNSDINTRIIDYGFTRPYLRESTTGKYRNSIFTGNAFYRSKNGTTGNWSALGAFNAKSPYAQYHSIDTSYLNKEITSNYSIQEIGYGFNRIPNYITTSIDSQGSSIAVNNTIKSEPPLLIAKTRTDAQKADLFLFFEEGKIEYDIQNPKKINNASYVAEVDNTQDTTYIGDNQAIAIKQCSRFWHIQVDSSVNGAFTKYPNKEEYDVKQEKGNTNDHIFINDGVKIKLARIVNEIASQYGSIADAEYIPSVVRLDDQSLNITGTSSLNLEGDTYVCKTFMRRVDLLHNGGQNPVSTDVADIEWFDAHMIIGTYVETKNNLTLRYKEINGGAEYYPKFRKIYGPDPATAGMMNLPLNTDTFSYNKQYSALNNTKTNVAQPLFFEDINNYPNRSIYSNQSFESENIDQYRIFPYTQFHDIPKDRGIITDTFVFNNTFFHHTEYGLWQSYFNPNTVQSTSQGDIVLGNSGIFKIPSKLIVDIKGGYMGTNDKSGTNTPFGRVFLDHYQGKVFLFAGDAPIEISDLGLFPFFREFVNTNSKYSMGYDWANKRLLISNHDDKDFYSNNANIEIINGQTHNIPQTAFNIGILTSNKCYKTNYSNINNNGDYYKFELKEKTNIKFLLKNYSSNYNLIIRNNSQGVIATSIESGLSDEKIKIILNPGIYYIFVVANSFLTTIVNNSNYELFITLDKGMSTISYYPKTQTWTSLHDFSPTAYLSLNREIYAWQDSSRAFYNLTNPTGTRKSSYITFVENTTPDAFKRFDRIEMNTMSGGNTQGIFDPGSIVNAANYQFIDKSFTNIHCWTDRQNSTELAFAYPTDFNTNFLSNYNPAEVTVNYYKGSFHAELPLDAVQSPYLNIFDSNNLNINANFRAHMKAKFLYTKLSYNSQDPLVLNYVKTYFKPTVA